jgi:hypothetical protein
MPARALADGARHTCRQANVYGCLPSELKYAKRVERASRRQLFPAAPVSDSTPDTSEEDWLNVTRADAEGAREEQKAGGERGGDGGGDGGGEACTMSCLERKLLARFQDHVERLIRVERLSALEVLLSPASTRPPTYNHTTHKHTHTHTHMKMSFYTCARGAGVG